MTQDHLHLVTEVEIIHLQGEDMTLDHLKEGDTVQGHQGDKIKVELHI
jgi:hypothetical protein